MALIPPSPLYSGMTCSGISSCAGLLPCYLLTASSAPSFYRKASHCVITILSSPFYVHFCMTLLCLVICKFEFSTRECLNKFMQHENNRSSD